MYDRPPEKLGLSEIPQLPPPASSLQQGSSESFQPEVLPDSYLQDQMKRSSVVLEDAPRDYSEQRSVWEKVKDHNSSCHVGGSVQESLDNILTSLRMSPEQGRDTRGGLGRDSDKEYSLSIEESYSCCKVRFPAEIVHFVNGERIFGKWSSQAGVSESNIQLFKSILGPLFVEPGPRRELSLGAPGTPMIDLREAGGRDLNSRQSDIGRKTGSSVEIECDKSRMRLLEQKQVTPGRTGSRKEHGPQSNPFISDNHKLFEMDSDKSINFEKVRRVLTKYWLGQRTWISVFNGLNQYELWIFGVVLWKRFGVTRLEQMSSIESLLKLQSSEKVSKDEKMIKKIHKMFIKWDLKKFRHREENTRAQIRRTFQSKEIPLEEHCYTHVRRAYQIEGILPLLGKRDFRKFDFMMDILTGKAIMKKDGTAKGRRLLTQEDNWKSIVKVRAPDKISKSYKCLLWRNDGKRERFKRFLAPSSADNVMLPHIDDITNAFRNKKAIWGRMDTGAETSKVKFMRRFWEKVTSPKNKFPMTMAGMKRGIPEILKDMARADNEQEYLALRKLHYWPPGTRLSRVVDEVYSKIAQQASLKNSLTDRIFQIEKVV